MSSSITEKIAKVLNQAENAGTEAEAATFMAKAQELATAYSIDLAKARHATIVKERTVPTHRRITLGVRGTRGLNTLVALWSGIADANDLTINIAHNSTYVIAFGFAEDIDVAEALFSSLSVQMAQAAAAYRKEGSWKSETVWRNGRYVGSGWDREWIEGDFKPITWLTARLDFQLGFARRVGQRLQEAKDEAEMRAKISDMEAAADGAAAIDGGSTGTALVLVEKREAVRDYYRQKSNARGSYRGYRSASSSRSLGAGRAAGDKARLSSATSLPGARRSIA